MVSVATFWLYVIALSNHRKCVNKWVWLCPHFIYWTPELEFHIIFTCLELFFFFFPFCQPFKNAITLLSLRAIPEQAVGYMWPVDHRLLTLVLERSFCSNTGATLWVSLFCWKQQQQQQQQAGVERTVGKRRPLGEAACYLCRILHSWWPHKHGPELELKVFFFFLHESSFNDNISSWCFSYKSANYAWNWCTLFHHELIW